MELILLIISKDVLHVNQGTFVTMQQILVLRHSSMTMVVMCVQKVTIAQEEVLLKFHAHQELTTHSKAKQQQETVDCAKLVLLPTYMDLLVANLVVNLPILGKALLNVIAKVYTEHIHQLTHHVVV